MKKFIILMLAILMVACCFTGCRKKTIDKPVAPPMTEGMESSDYEAPPPPENNDDITEITFN